jgi:hypothetical protein
LKQKNKTLNDKLTTYRINFVNNIFNQTNYWQMKKVVI